jgi:hypothetical protein
MQGAEEGVHLGGEWVSGDDRRRRGHALRHGGSLRYAADHHVDDRSGGEPPLSNYSIDEDLSKLAEEAKRTGHLAFDVSHTFDHGT